jgi:trk system potassium uptake protein TrkA
MRIAVLGAGHVGMTIVEALNEAHELVVVDLDAQRLEELSYAYDVRTVRGNCASRRVLQEAGVEQTELVLASTSRAEVNLLAAMVVRRMSNAKTIVRTTDVDYLESWREGQLDVDFMVSSEIEAAREVAATIAVPAARATEMFADGQVQIVEFDVPNKGAPATLIGCALRDADLPADSTVAAIIRDDALVPARAHTAILPGDRIIVITSPSGARAWSRLLNPDEPPIDDVVIFGAGRTGSTVARRLLDHGFAVRIVEPEPERARRIATELPRATVFHVTGRDRQFLRRERIGRAGAAVTATGSDATNLYLAIMAKSIGVPFTLGIVDDPMSVAIFEHGGVNVAVNPRTETAEEMIRFAHDPRTRQLAMLDDNRFQVLDIEVRADSTLTGTRFRDLPQTGSVIGAVVRDRKAVFPHGEDVLRPGDRAIILVEADRAVAVEKAL